MWGQVIHTALYLGLIIGIIIIFKRDFDNAVFKLRMGNRLKMRRKAMRAPGRLEKHLEMLAGAAAGGRIRGREIIIISVAVFAAAMVTGLKSYSLPVSIIIAGIPGVMPYILLRIRLENMRHKASFEGESFITALLSKYRMTSFNMHRALELMAEDGKTPPLCKKALIKVLFNIRGTGDIEKIKKAFSIFDFSVNTNWSRTAAYNMAQAAASGINVSESLEDLLIQLREARSLAEERKRLNSEAGRMVVFMVPVSYVLSMLLAVKYVGMDMETLLRNQFFTPSGFAFFLFIFFLFILNLSILKIVENKRFDY